MKTFTIETIRAYLRGGEKIFNHPLIKTFVEARVQKPRVQCSLCEFSLNGKPLCGKEIKDWCGSFKLRGVEQHADTD